MAVVSVSGGEVAVPPMLRRCAKEAAVARGEVRNAN